MTEQPVWTETDSRDFLDPSEIAVPAREEQTRALLDLIPAEPSEGYERAIKGGWRPIWLTEKEQGEMPYRIVAHLKWLAEAGFSLVDCFYSRAGHAVYGGNR